MQRVGCVSPHPGSAGPSGAGENVVCGVGPGCRFKEIVGTGTGVAEVM